MIATEAPCLQVRKVDADFHGLALFEIGIEKIEEYAVGTVEQAEVAAHELVKQCLGLADPELIIEHSCLPPEAIGLVRLAQHDVWWDSSQNQVLREVISDLDLLAAKTVEAKGREHLLCSHSGSKELRLTDIPRLQAVAILQELGIDSDRADDIRLYPLG